ncbi:hypothetical protein SAMN04488540_10632 [Ferrimonas sediminum]|uniref:Uncharacterized protein n=1 Tax=Ferrimonas sediminum TaxID=718193 RepID=A0A1G8RZR2_9GAMM|nr:hypothetical protein SAMN04488540_10632 [Ferrimonas sediminum]
MSQDQEVNKALVEQPASYGCGKPGLAAMGESVTIL